MEGDHDLSKEGAIVFYNGRARYMGNYRDCLKEIKRLQEHEPLNPVTKEKLERRFALAKP